MGMFYNYDKLFSYNFLIAFVIGERGVGKTFGAKVAKLPLDGGFSCPNLDGTCGSGGCIYCSERGSGDFAPDALLPIAEQIAAQKKLFSRKWSVSRCIAYFQAHTNTYAPLAFLKEKFEIQRGKLDKFRFLYYNISVIKLRRSKLWLLSEKTLISSPQQESTKYTAVYGRMTKRSLWACFRLFTALKSI